jgi:hypothetical protein
MPGGTSEQIVSKASAVFGDRMNVANFPEKAADTKPDDLKGLKSKQVVKVDEKNHPLPETKPEKATVVVVCPTLAAYRAGSGSDFRLFADDQVVAVNRLGTYSFAYLDTRVSTASSPKRIMPVASRWILRLGASISSCRTPSRAAFAQFYRGTVRSL